MSIPRKSQKKMWLLPFRTSTEFLCLVVSAIAVLTEKLQPSVTHERSRFHFSGFVMECSWHVLSSLATYVGSKMRLAESGTTKTNVETSSSISWQSRGQFRTRAEQCALVPIHAA